MSACIALASWGAVESWVGCVLHIESAAWKAMSKNQTVNEKAIDGSSA